MPRRYSSSSPISLGYLAGITENILLGSAAVVLPLRQPWLTLKAAESIDALSDGRLLMGVASGDRPMEYPLFGANFAQRGKAFRDAVELLRDWGRERLPEGARLLPERKERAPLLAAGLAQQSPAWIGAHLDGWLSYPGTPEDHRQRLTLWREVAGDKPYVSFFHLDLDANPHAPLQRMRFGGRCGRQALIDELRELRALGVQHIGLQLRRCERALHEVIEELAGRVLPEFHAS